MADDKSFSASIVRNDKVVQSISVIGFSGRARPFVQLKLDGAVMDLSLIVQPDEARALAQALLDAANFAQPREVGAADLGIAA